jgi:high-affinity nickel-transport protein
MSARARLAAMGTAVVALHAAGWLLLACALPGHPALAGLGGLAYVLGVRHGLDVDHIAAIDNTARRLREDGQRPLSTGFFFSLGHASVVLVLSLAVALAATAVQPRLPLLRDVGGVVGPSVSGLFLALVGVLNTVALAGAVRRLLAGTGADGIPAGGLVRLLGRLFGRITRSWHMYPLGLLFGLGLDTATEVALLSLSAGAAQGAAPAAGIVALPVLFAAGMALVDTADGVAMSYIYGWAGGRPGRRAWVDVGITGASTALALTIAALQLLHVATGGLGELS